MTRLRGARTRLDVELLQREGEHVVVEGVQGGVGESDRASSLEQRAQYGVVEDLPRRADRRSDRRSTGPLLVELADQFVDALAVLERLVLLELEVGQYWNVESA